MSWRQRWNLIVAAFTLAPNTIYLAWMGHVPLEIYVQGPNGYGGSDDGIAKGFVQSGNNLSIQVPIDTISLGIRLTQPQ